MIERLDTKDMQAIENLITDRINQLRIEIDGDVENVDEFKEIIRFYKTLLNKLEQVKL